jgi:uncharacterized pyridoxamine 5'-phosphate oxidase family protein
MILTHRERIYKPHTHAVCYNTFFSPACSQQIIKVTNIVVQGNLKGTKVLIILLQSQAMQQKSRDTKKPVLKIYIIFENLHFQKDGSDRELFLVQQIEWRLCLIYKKSNKITAQTQGDS